MPSPLPPRVARAGMIARWKPVHLGHQAVLRAVCARAEHAVVGIGSANRYDHRNPFTQKETRAMITRALGAEPGYEIQPVPDLGDGPRWRAMVRERFGPLDLFVTANDYVRDLLQDVYRVVHPLELVPPEGRFPIDGTMVRLAMARSDAWQELVPPEVASYLVDEGLVSRFRREFGLRTLSEATG